MAGTAHLLETSPILGVGWAFPPRFQRGSSALVAGVEDIQQSLGILLGTLPGERAMIPRYGCDLTPLLFSPLTTTLAAEISDRVQTAILEFEPRIVPLRVTVSVADAVAGLLNIMVDYLIAATNSRHNFVHPFYRIEGTEIG